MTYLLKRQDVYRANTEKEAKQLIEDAKNDDIGELVKYSCDYREQKSKGEVIDSWYRVTVTLNFADEKNP